MGVPNTFIPKVTQAGKAAAIDASNAGLSLRITHLSFGLGQYDPTGFETALFNEIKRVPATGAMRPQPNQMRVGGVWVAQEDESEIGEIGIWAGAVLFAVWSRRVGGPIGYKTLGVDFVAFLDLVFDEVPAGSIEVVINTDVSEALSALIVHEVAEDAHTQYLLRSGFVSAHSLMTANTVGGTANAITLKLPNETTLTEYGFGQKVTFIASSNNTGPVSASVNSLGALSVRKNGSVSLAAGDIIAGAVYTLFHDGLAWQLSGGVGGGASLTRRSFTAIAGQKVFAFPYTPQNLLVMQNGHVLDESAYVATDGAQVVLNVGAAAGDQVVLLTFKSFAVTDTYTRTESDVRYIAKDQAQLLGPPGQVNHFATDTAPAGWVKANGAVVNRITYAALFAVIGTRFGAGDGVNTFRLPDLRGEFIRGWDDARGVDVGRTLGSTQRATFAAAGSGPNSDGISSYALSEGAAGRGELGLDPADLGLYPSARASNAGNTSTPILVPNDSDMTYGTMRPRNVALLACIKF